MSRQKNRLATVEALYANRESLAGRELAMAERALAAAEQQYELLVGARNEPRTPSATLGIGGLQNRAEFMRKLDQAIGQQRTVVDHARTSVETIKRRYLLCRQRTLAVGKANAKRLADQRTSADRREQKELDDWRAPAAQTDAGES